VPPATVAPPPTTAPVVAGAAPVTVSGVFAIGDSVMLGAAPQLRAKGIGVDAAESRQWNTGVSILGVRAAAEQLPRVVVVHLGTNGPINGGQLDALMRVLGGHRVVLLTAHEPRWWQNEVNDTLRAGVARWPGTVLLDWDAAGSTHPEWFYNDRIHLRPRGAQAYADLVAGIAV
jgi:lysophospholipase L1-like esterase